MKNLIKVVSIVLLVSLGACGKRNNHGNMAKAPPSNGTQDFSSVAYNPTAAGQSILMSDYLFLNSIAGNKDNKRLYSQMSLFLIKAKPSTADKTKKHQYQFFYREFVTCKDGPRPNRGGNTNAVTYLSTQTDEAILVKGGTANFTNLGQAVLGPRDKRQLLSANLKLAQNPRHPSMTNITLNFKKTTETLETYQNIPKPDPDASKIINSLDCANSGPEETSTSVPYGPIIAPTTTPDKQTFETSKLIQDDELSPKEVTSEDQPS